MAAYTNAEKQAFKKLVEHKQFDLIDKYKVKRRQGIKYNTQEPPYYIPYTILKMSNALVILQCGAVYYECKKDTIRQLHHSMGEYFLKQGR